MIDSVIAWAMSAPLEFIAVLCAIAGLVGLTVAPAFNERVHRNHPRC